MQKETKKEYNRLEEEKEKAISNKIGHIIN